MAIHEATARSRTADIQRGCGGGIMYPAEPCDRYVRYSGQKVKECLKANVQVFQDGYIACSLIDCYGCDKCMEEFEEGETG